MPLRRQLKLRFREFIIRKAYRFGMRFPSQAQRILGEYEGVEDITSLFRKRYAGLDLVLAEKNKNGIVFKWETNTELLDQLTNMITASNPLCFLLKEKDGVAVGSVIANPIKFSKKEK